MLAASLVERVVLLGSPLSIKGENWEEARKVNPILVPAFEIYYISL